jgi:hypothetical protein
MPRNVRNFWVSVSVPGQQDVERGPRNQENGIHITLFVRKNGSVDEKTLTIRGGRKREAGVLTNSLFLTVWWGDKIILKEEWNR